MSCNCDDGCNKHKCNDCNKDDNPCGCDVVTGINNLDDCCFIWVMCEDECGNTLPQKVSLMALKEFFNQPEPTEDETDDEL